MITIEGPFDLTAQPDPPFDTEGGLTLGRMRFDKRFHGALDATSVVHMTYARTADPGNAGYVALERITGTIDGRAGSFVVLHLGVLDGGAQSLTIPVVPGSGTGALAGLRGEMKIRIEAGGKHFYALSYELPRG